MYELNPPDDSARRAVRASEEFGAYLRDLLAERRVAPGRRPHQRAGGGRRRRRHADRDRAGRRPACFSSTPATRPRSTAPATAGGRSSAIPTRWLGCAPSPTCCRPPSRSSCASTRRSRCSSAGSSSRSRSTVSRSRGAGRSRCCSGRPTATRTRSHEPDDARPRARPEPVPVVRCRDPLLPRRAAGQAGARDRLRDAAPSGAAAGARRDAALEADLRPARPRGAARPGLTPCATSRSATRTRSGPSSPPAERWPDQLVAALGGRCRPLELVANLGVNGYTSADLIRDELPALDDLRPEFVTLLIGVNDVVQGVAPATYEKNVVAILDASCWIACPPTGS